MTTTTGRTTAMPDPERSAVLAAPERVLVDHDAPSTHPEAAPDEVDPQTDGRGYWYPDAEGAPTPVDVLNLLRRYREAERRMRVRTRESMRMGETDLVALRFLIKARQRGVVVRQKELADALEITSASASALVDRLSRDGYVRRVPHPDDRRSVAVEPTAHTDTEVRETLGSMHRRMLEAVESLDRDEREVVARFLQGLVDAVS